jgi:hypothetical protein
MTPEVQSVLSSQVGYLHRELILRMGLQNAILMLMVPVFIAAAIAACTLPSHAPVIAIAYVTASGMASLYWVHSGYRTAQIRVYLQSLERDATGWENWLAKNHYKGPLGSRWWISTVGVFIGSQVAMTAICWLATGSGGLDYLFLVALAGPAINLPLLRRSPLANQK